MTEKTGFITKDEIEKLPFTIWSEQYGDDKGWFTDLIVDSSIPYSDDCSYGINWAALTCTILELSEPCPTDKRFTLTYHYGLGDEIHDSVAEGVPEYESDSLDDIIAKVDEIADKLNKEYGTSFDYHDEWYYANDGDNDE